ncbi:MAG: ABC transporter ATP-binding protein [Planctomycetota bacterium]
MSPQIEEPIHGKAYDARLVRRLVPFARPYSKRIGLSIGLLIGLFVLDLLIPWILRIAVDGPIQEARESQAAPGAWEELIWLAVALLVVAILRLGFQLAQLLVMTDVGQSILHDLRLSAFSHLQSLSLAFFDRHPVGRLVTRVTNDIETLNELFTSGVTVVFYDLVKIVGVVAVLLWIDPKLTGIALLGLPVLTAVSFAFRSHARKAYREIRSRVSRLNAFLQELLQGIRVIQLFNQEQRVLDRFDEVNVDHRRAHVRAHLNWSLFFPSIDLVSMAILAGIVWVSGLGIAGGELQFGVFLQFWIMLGYLFDPIRELSEKYNVFQSAMASAERLFGLLDEAPEISGPENPYRPEEARGEIELRDVTFGYGDGPDVLRNVSFHVKPGEKIAIVGATGAGKTTLINLLSRYYDVRSGSILVDGHDVREYDPKDLRHQIGLVLQEVFLFPGDILENIRLGDTSISEERVIEAARLVGADRFIQKLPDGYRSEVRERGATQSVGEKQLIAFARVLTFDPSILILDEATAHIDPETERLLQKALERTLKGRTAILIAHRLATIRHADRILVFHHGELREAGTHQELLERGGLYHRLHQLQFG